MSMKRLAITLALTGLAGCSCDTEPTLHSDVTPPPPSEAPMIQQQLPMASRSDLPRPTPAVTITVDDRAFLVTNRPIVETWPEAELAAVGRTRPLGDAEYPIVEREVDDGADTLIVAGLQTAMTAIVAVEDARVAITHAGGRAAGFAVRAGPDVRYARVLSAVYAAAMFGFNEPRFVLASPSGERELRLMLPNGVTEPDDPAIAAAVAAALATLDQPSAVALDAGPTRRAMRTSIVLAADGLRFHRGALRYAPGCAEPALEGSTAPTLPTASITPSAIDACLAAIDSPGIIIFQAPRATRYADAVALLETLAAHHEVSLATPLE